MAQEFQTIHDDGITAGGVRAASGASGWYDPEGRVRVFSNDGHRFDVVRVSDGMRIHSGTSERIAVEVAQRLIASGKAVA